MFKINDRITWVGKIDWDLKKFHGEEYSTHRGSSYNSYLIEDEKIALIDTVWQPFDEEFITNLKKVIDLKKIDYIIANHGEVDHSGGLPELMREIPGTPIYCTANGIKSLKGHYHQDWNFVQVKTGDTLDLGEGKLIFIEAPMLHWPDNMFEYYTKDEILFSNDAFGQHYASEFMYNDLVDQAELYQEALKYYANILTPFSPLVSKKIHEVLGFNVPVSMICPAHGIIWRENPTQIVEKYLEWADNYQEHQVTVIYDTMWDATKKMAEAIAEGVKSVDPTLNIKLYNVGTADKNDVISEVFKAKLVVAGSSTINKGILSAMAATLEMIKGLNFKNKKAAGFGSYGWSGESPKLMKKALEDCGFDVLEEGLGVLWKPDENALKLCRDYGTQLANKL
ncbi:flavorubredoxin oxidoreductase [Petrocella atlantisensis]|uniref:Flavorubredoxin oxidoreductase n=1 Tax=Petrocella atlantisensis TaxID=2173034 RepID=A0A3P7S015_9FIRM|nr:anaerobic nitric oxide reductase flavorubredoxin [Petrocella atlantisensis]VDN48236.1 flavorubredoxin oxidoreductase [Petrocella atlantisensis]